jgi:aspartokinase
VALIVQKFGGTSVADIDRIRIIAGRAARTRAAGHSVVVVVSAMAGETNRLLALAKAAHPRPDEREADVLASTANLLHTSGFKMGAPYGEGTANFEAMREWNRATIYRKTIGYFADQLVGR